MEERRRIRLTKYSTEAGSASKFAPVDLAHALEGLSPESLEGFVSGMETRDNAGYVPFGGGLLLTAPEDRAWELVRLLHQDGVSAAIVGEVVEGAGVRATA